MQRRAEICTFSTQTNLNENSRFIAWLNVLQSFLHIHNYTNNKYWRKKAIAWTMSISVNLFTSKCKIKTYLIPQKQRSYQLYKDFRAVYGSVRQCPAFSTNTRFIPRPFATGTIAWQVGFFIAWLRGWPSTFFGFISSKCFMCEIKILLSLWFFQC